MRIIATLSAFLILSALAQQPDLPKPETQDRATPAPSSALSPAPTSELIPSDVLSSAERAASANLPPPTIPAITQFDEVFKQNLAGAAADNARYHAECRQLQNRVANDSDLKAALRFAEAAKTDLEKRERLRKYYELSFGKMSELAESAELRAYLVARKNGQLAALPQPRVRPPSPSPRPAR